LLHRLTHDRFRPGARQIIDIKQPIPRDEGDAAIGFANAECGHMTLQIILINRSNRNERA
jgi:hypothetical protein